MGTVYNSYVSEGVMGRTVFSCLCSLVVCFLIALCLPGCRSDIALSAASRPLPMERDGDGMQAADGLEFQQPPAESPLDVRLSGGCDLEREEIVVPKAHARIMPCELANAWAAQDSGGAYEVVDETFTWHVAQPKILEVECPFGADHALCRLNVTHDMFDADGVTEPSTFVIACVEQSGPFFGQPRRFRNRLCASRRVVSVVNLEGTWTFESAALGDAFTLRVLQEGRMLYDEGAHIGHAFVEGAVVHFTRGDTLFVGEILPDRGQIEGVVFEMMGMTSLGAWHAVREND